MARTGAAFGLAAQVADREKEAPLEPPPRRHGIYASIIANLPRRWSGARYAEGFFLSMKACL